MITINKQSQKCPDRSEPQQSTKARPSELAGLSAIIGLN